MKYLLPCSQCEKQHTIGVSQAGERLTCDCGHVIAIPSFREIRQLKPAGDTQVTPQRSGKGSYGRNAIMAVGMTFALVGLLLAGYGVLIRAQIRIPDAVVDSVDLEAESVNDMSPGETLSQWSQMISEGLGPYRPSEHVVASWHARHYQWIAGIGGIVLGVGLLIVAIAWFLPRVSQQRAA